MEKNEKKILKISNYSEASRHMYLKTLGYDRKEIEKIFKMDKIKQAEIIANRIKPLKGE